MPATPAASSPPAATPIPTASRPQLPRPDELARGDFEMIVSRLADDLAFGSDNSMFLGGGLEYASSRPYQPGDSIRLLNWRLTARTGKAYIKEYEALKRTCVYLVIDTSASMAVASTPLRKHDIAVWAGAAIGLVAQRRMSPVAVVGAGDRSIPVLPSLLRGDLWRSIEPLRTGDYAESTRLAERLGQLDARVQRSSVLIVVSDLHDPNAVAALRRASQKHDCVVLHTQDPAEAGGLRAGFFRGEESETGGSFLAHSRSRWPTAENIRLELARSGVDYLLLRSDRPFIAPLRHFLGSRGHLLRGRL